MPSQRTVKLPSTLMLEPSLRFIAELAELGPSDEYILDFSALVDTPPFGMLLVGTAIRQFRDITRGNRPETLFRAVGITDLSYPSHMGFLQCCGVPVGNLPGEAPGSHRYLPITRLPLSVFEVWQKPVAEVILETAAELAALLVQGESAALERALSYSIRELMRNTSEHSKANAVWYAAQYWPTSDNVELVILDEGRGILSSLRENQSLVIKNEADAIQQSVLAGVSGSVSQTSRELGADDFYGNSGYGLFVLRELARRTGNLVVLSNTDAVIFNERGSDTYSTALRGTAIRLRFSPSKLGGQLEHILKALPPEPSLSKRTAASQSVH